MSAAFEYGVVPGGSLMMLEQLIHEIYLPMLAAGTGNGTGNGNGTPAAAEPPAAATSSEASSEFVGNLQKFGSQISHAIQQVSGDFRLTMPQLIIDDPAVACEDYEIVVQLEAALEDWTPAIASALETQLAKQPVGKGPLAEIEFWRARNAALSTLCEQLNTPNARRMLEVLERVESQLLSGFYGFYGELARDLTAPPRRAATP